MVVRYLGWAGFEVEASGESLVIDPLQDPLAVWSFLGDGAAAAERPVVVPADRSGRASAGLLSHLHRDHADAAALRGALDEEGVVLEPEAGGGKGMEDLGLAQAEHELAESGLNRRRVGVWERQRVGPFEVTALPAVDGSGDPQVSWLVEAEGVRVLHLGDTLFHGFWWRMVMRHGPFDLVLTPINGAVLNAPHRQPSSRLPAAMDPVQAAEACRILGARRVVPMHYGGLTLEPLYTPVEGAEERFVAEAAERKLEVTVLEPGASLEVAPAPEPVEAGG